MRIFTKKAGGYVIVAVTLAELFSSRMRFAKGSACRLHRFDAARCCAVQTRPTVRRSHVPVIEKTWNWNGHKIRYQSAGEEGPPAVLIHGFGGNCDHWRKNVGYLGEDCRAYAIDLLGFGYSDKPDPNLEENASIYTFDTWAKQIADFTAEVVQEPSFLVCNSIGGVAGLQTAVAYPETVQAVQLLNISLRQLHVRNQSPFMRPFIKAFQRLLRDTVLGQMFFEQVAKPETVRKILQEAYNDPDTVTDELVDLILKPGLEPGAVDVFLSFISYSGGPLPGELLAEVSKPVSILWGSKDPWEKVEEGRRFASLPSVEEFIEIPDGGHCVMCEKSEIVNPLIQRFIQRHTDVSALI